MPLIGNGIYPYQIISVFDYVLASRRVVDLGVPDDTFDLGSDAPPQIQDLLSNLTKAKKSTSRLLIAPGQLVKLVLRFLDFLGLTIPYKEQYSIADATYIVDISHTKDALSWTPAYSDEDMIIAAYDEYIEQRDKG